MSYPPVSDVAISQRISNMNNTRQTIVGGASMQLLLVGDDKDDLGYLSDLLSRSGNGRLDLDRASSVEEARIRMDHTAYDLLLCEYKSGDGTALHLLHDVHKNGPGTPVIFLSDHVDEATVEAALKAGATDVQPRGVEEASVARSIRYAIDVYCKERQRQKAEDTLRKLARAVEQSADLVIITDRTGVI